ncbi:hypothetical protein [Rhodospirillum rubrum]|uniref:Uncharacterized protein n=1 Tax=Rhodospirillum rubrum (strain ATCC 11170 / ATH 1.1.1 / DSM 467 / LMG 4362 / NCIMB 8255 / S1) TaxID=269796 RepID=Q2RW52_RHORT|nr:hypothetical protein [Rhodospirillum rubrum]ABC21643.1 hypothetical protein Rru_A0842 [Rhodospirillum rubrum ATCC 11170]AEO47337.1 hypothetical protein F11_04335 [Rhodospirillum rubrum F11]QXG81309.1 hypothetical protein KUL73_04395 [Rhodospirillum rubrum]HAQ00010.1 hypothetical protein [Rhodospirillum rubrum]
MDQHREARSAMRSWLAGQGAILLGKPLDEVQALSDDDDLPGYDRDPLGLTYARDRLRTHGVAFADPSRRGGLAPAALERGQEAMP